MEKSIPSINKDEYVPNIEHTICLRDKAEAYILQPFANKRLLTIEGCSLVRQHGNYTAALIDKSLFLYENFELIKKFEYKSVSAIDFCSTYLILIQKPSYAHNLKVIDLRDFSLVAYYILY